MSFTTTASSAGSSPIRDSPTRSVASRLPSRELLFGEIDSTATHSLKSNTSICNLTLSSSASFLKFWLNDNVRSTFLDCLDQEDLCRLRLVCHDFSGKIASQLFHDLHISFRSSTFSRPSRLAALDRIGRHVRSVTVALPAPADHVLPPLVDPSTGEEKQFVYAPQLQPCSRSADNERHAAFGSWEVADLLIKQYPPIFHAATNVATFVRAFGALPLLSHLKISCPGHLTVQQRGGRTVAEYALIAIRMAVERASLPHLNALSYLPIHPSGLLYMQPLMGLGAGPGSMKRWAQIQKMEVHMEGDDTDKAVRLDQLKTLHTYLRNFACCLTSFQFRWKGSKGPCPISLATEPCFSIDSASTKEGVADQLGRAPSQRSPPQSKLRGIHFTSLAHMELENAVMDAAQISAFICEHRRTLTEFKFEQVKLRTGDWDEALLPIAKMAAKRRHRAEQQRLQQKQQWRETVECMEVPIIFNPNGTTAQIVPGTATAEPDSRPILSEKHPLMRGDNNHSAHFALSRLLSKATRKTREHLNESSEQVRRLLRSSMLGRK